MTSTHTCTLREKALRDDWRRGGVARRRGRASWRLVRGGDKSKTRSVAEDRQRTKSVTFLCANFSSCSWLKMISQWQEKERYSSALVRSVNVPSIHLHRLEVHGNYKLLGIWHCCLLQLLSPQGTLLFYVIMPTLVYCSCLIIVCIWMWLLFVEVMHSVVYICQFVTLICVAKWAVLPTMAVDGGSRLVKSNDNCWYFNS